MSGLVAKVMAVAGRLRAVGSKGMAKGGEGEVLGRIG